MDKVSLNAKIDVEQTRALRRIEPAKQNQNAAATPRPESHIASREPDTINVSEHAAAVGRLTARVAELPDVRQEKVERLSALVQSGSYALPASDIIAELGYPVR